MARSLLAFCFVAAAAGHLCMLHPLQRGGAQGSDSPGAKVCFQTTGPCGTEHSGLPMLRVKANSVVHISILKNLNHLNAEAPGNFTLRGWPLGHEAEPGPLVGFFSDYSNAPMQTFNTSVLVPQGTPAGRYVLQAVYNTNNPQAPAAFYQCSDVLIE
eukprot:TRINITY_DN13691_c0_g1_i1.p2 TRINITY_DN13691_c0_g1~~TRINITY_DN13691_c0_g1_i1.p2  ORF type:complete len:157 (+),score=42.76 TRINITY_DN13691_c0_g1_i1:49-519(+)